MNKLLMPHGSLKSLFSQTQTLFTQTFRNVTSALFVTGDQGLITTSIIAPFIDLKERLKDPQDLQKNLKARNLSINVESLKEKWSQLLEMCEIRNRLTDHSKSLIEELSQRVNSSNIDEGNSASAVEQYRLRQKLVKQDIKFISHMIQELEKITIFEGLRLPNYIHKDTPLDREKVQYSYDNGDESKTANLDHVEIGKKLELLEFSDEISYYLLNQAVQFELALTDYFASNLINNFGFMNFSNTDFCKSVVIEGVGHRLKEENSVFRLQDYSETPNEDEQTFLVGGASLEPFCAYHCKSTIDESTLPLKYVTQGRSYSSSSLYNFKGLYSVVQTNSVKIFIATNNNEEAMMNEFNLILQTLTDLYKRFNLTFRYTFVPASSLNLWESLKVSFQIYSPYHKQFIEVGELSISDDFISKRLRMHYHKRKKDPLFMKIISGKVVNVAPFLACILERSQDDFIIPECLRNHTL